MYKTILMTYQYCFIVETALQLSNPEDQNVRCQLQ